MSENEWYLERYKDRKPSLGFWIFQQMSIGAVWAALALFGLIAVMLIFVAIGGLLPDDAREAGDPSPWPVSQSSSAGAEAEESSN
ncbi:MAG: RC-LH1 core complex protein PufX [Pseudomonadota bacterium]